MEGGNNSGSCFGFRELCRLRVRVFYHPQRSWGKVIFSEACVKNSVHIREQCMLGDTGNKRVVRILLECIIYWPQRSCGQGNIFTPVCHSSSQGGECLRQTPPGADPPGTHTPPEQTPLRPDTPQKDDTPLGADPPRTTPPLGVRHPFQDADTPPD